MKKEKKYIAGISAIEGDQIIHDIAQILTLLRHFSHPLFTSKGCVSSLKDSEGNSISAKGLSNYLQSYIEGINIKERGLEEAQGHSSLRSFLKNIQQRNNAQKKLALPLKPVSKSLVTTRKIHRTGYKVSSEKKTRRYTAIDFLESRRSTQRRKTPPKFSSEEKIENKGAKNIKAQYIGQELKTILITNYMNMINQLSV